MKLAVNPPPSAHEWRPFRWSRSPVRSDIRPKTELGTARDRGLGPSALVTVTSTSRYTDHPPAGPAPRTSRSGRCRPRSTGPTLRPELPALLRCKRACPDGGDQRPAGGAGVGAGRGLFTVGDARGDPRCRIAWGRPASKDSFQNEAPPQGTSRASARDDAASVNSSATHETENAISCPSGAHSAAAASFETSST